MPSSVSSPGTIYLITNMVNGKRYVGFTTKTAQARWACHVKNASRPSAGKYNQILYRAIQKYGAAAFTVETVAVFSDASMALKVEEPRYIAHYNSHFKTGHGYNMTFGGEGTLGAVWSEESRQKFRQYKKTDAHRRKLSESQRGRTLSDPHRAALITAARNRSPELRAKQTARLRQHGPWNRGKFGYTQHTEEFKRAVAIRASKACEITLPSGDKVRAESIAAFCRQHQLNPHKMCEVARGVRPHHRRYTARYLGSPQ